MDRLFRNRCEAGQVLAKLLASYADAPNTLVLALPRGGVEVAYEVAKALRLPLDVMIVRKLGVPLQKELAMGAIASGGARALNQDVIDSLGISEEELEKAIRVEQQELQRRERLYRGDRPPLNVQGCTVLLVDDGLATGATMSAAIEAVRALGAARIVVAVPVAPASTVQEMLPGVSEFVCHMTPQSFFAIGQFYDDFAQVSDHRVQELLHRAPQAAAGRIEHPSHPLAADHPGGPVP